MTGVRDDWAVRRWICDYIDAHFGRGETINPAHLYFVWRERDVLGKWKPGDFYTLVYIVCSDLAWVGMTAECEGEYIMLHHRSELSLSGLIGSGTN